MNVVRVCSRLVLVFGLRNVVGLLSSSSCGLCSSRWVRLICCVLLLDRLKLCLLIMVFRFCGRVVVKCIICVVLVIVCRCVLVVLGLVRCRLLVMLLWNRYGCWLV